MSEREEQGGETPRQASGTTPGAQPPVELTGLRRGEPAEVAGGWGAVAATMRHVREEMGLLRGTKLLMKVNQKTGFDCPSCAWPDPDDHRAKTEFCENGAKAVADEATTKSIGADFFAKRSLQDLAGESDYWLGKQGRLIEPLFKAEGDDHYRPISWEDAFARIGSELKQLGSADEALFYTSGRTSNEAAFLYQLFVRRFGTNNLPDCSNMCHESSGVGLKETIGVGKGTVTLDDFLASDLILILGQNPGTNHPRMMSTLQDAKRRGATIISVNPLREAGLTRFKHPQEVSGLVGSGTELADHFVQLRINGDVAFLKGLMAELLAIEDENPGRIFDQDFITEHCDGFEDFIADLRRVDLERIVEDSGVARSQIAELATIVAHSKAMICCWAMGLTQHKNAVGNIREVVNLLLLGGHMGRKGAGACPVRGHSNVQGDRTMGIWEAPSEDLLDRIEARFGFAVPREHGFPVVEAIRAMHDGRAKVFFAMGGNFLSATPDTEFTAEALQRLRLSVQVSTKLNRSHLIVGKEALILPCLGRSEIDLQGGEAQMVSMENSMGIVHPSRGQVDPASEQLRSEVSIVASLAEATLGGESGIDWSRLASNYDLIRDEIEGTIPGHESYNQRLREPGGFYLDNAARRRSFATATGKARFSVNDLPDLGIAEGAYTMMTIRSHDQFNTTVYGLDDRYRGIYNERRVVMMNAEDMRADGFEEGQLVDLESHFRGSRRQAKGFIVVAYDLPRRCVATYFPEANVLVPVDHFADRSHTPASKSVEVTLQASAKA